MDHLSTHLDLTRYQKPIEDARDPSEFAKYVRLTSELIGRPYIQTFRMVQHWPQWKIEQRYKEALNCPAETKPAIRWWAMRRKFDKPQPHAN